MRKKYHCCIPGCTTYDTLNNFLQIPPDTEWRNKWLSIIPRRNWVVDHSTIVCLKHFHSNNFLKTASSNGLLNNGSSTLKLLNGSVPTVVPKQNEPKLINQYVPAEMFQLFPRDGSGPELFEDIEKIENTDYVIDYWYLQLMYPKRLSPMLTNNWKVVTTAECTIFYIVDFSEIPRISISVKVDLTLQVTVTLAGREMDPADLTWILPINGKVNRWSQLQFLLTIFGKNNNTDV